MERKEAIEIVRKLYNESLFMQKDKEAMVTLIPELKENEDERIRKWIRNELESKYVVDNIVNNVMADKAFAWLEKQGENMNPPKFTFDDVLALQCAMYAAKKVQKDKDLYEQLENLHDRLHDTYWLEKQGEQNIKHFELKAGHWYICHRAYCCRADHLTVKEGERFMCEEDGVVKGFVIKYPEKYFKEVCAPTSIEDKGRHADEVKPKFKVGDFILNGDVTNKGKHEIFKVLKVCSSWYDVENIYDGRQTMITFAQEYTCKRWTIQDAKDGDVLAASDGSIFIFKEIVDCGCKHYIALEKDNETINVNDNLKHFWEAASGVKPATKEQRDLLFQKMKEAGYEWNAEKKELKDIENKHAWSEEDERNLKGIICEIEINKFNAPEYDMETYDGFLSWLKSLKDRV